MSRPVRLHGGVAFLGWPGGRARDVLVEVDPVLGRIVDVRAGVPAGEARADLEAPALAPGLIDPHVHLDLPGDGTEFEEALALDDARLTELVLERARRLLDGGVTTARDVGSRGRTALEARDRIARGGAPGPRLLVSGAPLTVPRGHCWWLGGEVADEPEAARAAVRARVAEGVDLIKVMASGGGTPGTVSWDASFSATTLAAIVDEARAHGLEVTAHCLCAEATRRSLAAGVARIEHAAFGTGPDTAHFEPDVADALAAAQVPVNATLAVSITTIRALEARPARSDEEEATLRRRRTFRAARLAQTAACAARGVRFLAGSDAGWRDTAFPAVVDELEELVAAGLEPDVALAGAMAFAAEALRMDAGRLEAGAAADVIGLGVDPALDLGTLRRPQWVVQGGRVHRAMAASGR